MSTKMPRTLISLPPGDMRWLKSESKRRGQAMAMTVREAVAEYRVRTEEKTWISRLQAAKGLWKDKGIDALEYVDKLRSEWDR